MRTPNAAGGVWHTLEELLFRIPFATAGAPVRVVLLPLLFLAGLAHWMLFLFDGSPSFLAHDWFKESAYLDTLREALTRGVVPWDLSRPLYFSTVHFLANPEVVLTPDVLLLRWLPDDLFVFVHLALFYSLGSLGCLLLAERSGANLVSSLFFWLGFNFNGYLTAHLAVGHFQWAGYFLFPFLFLHLIALSGAPPGARTAERASLGLASVLGLLFLNGSIHMAIWCIVCISVTTLFRPSIARWTGPAIAGGSLLGFARLLPAALYFPRSGEFISGYPGVVTVLDALTQLRGPGTPLAGNLAWWEYDCFVGFVLFAGLLLGVLHAIRQGRVRIPRAPLAAAGVMLMLSLGDVHGLIAGSHLPFSTVERVSSRFVLVPFLAVLLVAWGGLDALTRIGSLQGRLTAVAALPFAAYELARHSARWRLAQCERTFGVGTRFLPDLAPGPDATYAFVVGASWIVSLAALLGILTLLILGRRRSGEGVDTRERPGGPAASPRP